MRAYYRLREYIPAPIRRALQRTRNQSMSVPQDWHLNLGFVNDCKQALTACSDALSQPVVHPWPSPFNGAFVLTHDVEPQAGFDRILDIAQVEEQYGLRSCWNIVPHYYKVDIGVLKELQARGHEVGVHGYNHDGRLFWAKDIFNQRVPSINQAAKDFGASGFRAPMVHRNLNWIQQLEFDYDASCFDFDPFQPMPGGVGSVWPFIAGNLVELPYTLPQDHTLLVTLNETTPRIWIEKAEQLKTMAGMALLITHPDYLDCESRIAVYRQLLEHVVADETQWKALPAEVAHWWREREASCIVGTDDNALLVGPAQRRGRITHLGALFSRWGAADQISLQPSSASV